MGLLGDARQFISTLGYNAGLGQFGIGQNTSYGTPYNPAVNPQQVSAGTSPAFTGYQSTPNFGSPSPVNINTASTGFNGQAVLPASTSRNSGQPSALPTNGDGVGGGVDTSSAQSQSDAELQAALSALDYQRGQYNQQLGQVGEQKTNALSDLDVSLGRSQKQAAESGTLAEQSTQTQKNKALSTAQDVQKSNRNVLRALGILSSSAAGEMLNKPINEYGKQAADLGQQLVQRKNDIQQWLQDRTAEHQTAVRDVQSQYANLVGQIQNDLRFNDRQRSDAVRSASAALQTRIQQIQESAKQYALTAQNYNNQILQQVAQLQLYQNPQANTGAIQNQLLSSMIPTQQYNNPTSAITQTEEQRKKALGY